jgi:hypothetical protein
MTSSLFALGFHRVSSICFLDPANAACFALGCLDGPELTMTGRTMLGFVIAPFGGVLTFFLLGLFLSSGETILSTDQVSWRLAYGWLAFFSLRTWLKRVLLPRCIES